MVVRHVDRILKEMYAFTMICLLVGYLVLFDCFRF